MRNRILIAVAALLVAPIPVLAQARQQGVTITFLANEGVLLAADGKKVLIDALFEKYKTGFALPADSTRAALAAARAPFNNVDALLFTHYHGDHFHPAPVVAHMRANPHATLLTSRQVIDSLRGRLRADDPVAQRFRARTTSPGTRRREIVNGINIELLGLPHGGRPGVEHLGYVVELGGRRVLHLGDTDFSAETFAPFRLDTLRIDVALVPDWALLHAPSRDVVQRWIRPRQVVAIHVGEGNGARVERELRRLMPAALTFSRPLEVRTW
jgi:L-ascorbate metabolism protein UlaG (beta-lactamase superfamily)